MKDVGHFSHPLPKPFTSHSLHVGLVIAIELGLLYILGYAPCIFVLLFLLID